MRKDNAGRRFTPFIQLFDGPGARINGDNFHYWPYGLNYDNEDSPQNRIREVKLVSAMRFDMGIVGDGDGDGLPDEWEMYRFGNLAQNGTGDADGDGISNHDEWWTEGDPMLAAPVRNGHTYVIRARHSQKVIEAADSTAGANVRQNPLSGSDLQKWTATYAGGGYRKFVNVASGKCRRRSKRGFLAGAMGVQVLVKVRALAGGAMALDRR